MVTRHADGNTTLAAATKRLCVIGASAVVLSTVVPAVGRDGPAVDRCRDISDGPARLRCYDQAAPKAPPAASPETSRSTGAWRLVRTPHPQGGKDAISIMHAADPARSDPEFVGVMLRCGTPDIEVLTVVIPPLPPRTKPLVTIGTGPQTREVAGEVTPPGAAIRLPADVSAEARKEWGRTGRVDIVITRDGQAIRGSVELDGFTPALQALSVACAGRRDGE
jgi:hypothetical protein